MTKITPVPAAVGGIGRPLPLPPAPAAAPVAGASFDTPVPPAGADRAPRPAAAPTTPVDASESRPGPGKQPKALLTKALQGVTQVDPAARVSIDRTRNAATFLSGSFAVELRPGVTPRDDIVATEFLNRHGVLFGVEQPRAQLRLLAAEKDELGMQHFRYQQYAGDLPVFGQQLVVHAQGNVVRSVGGRVVPNVKVATEPKVEPRSLLQSLAGAAPEGTDPTAIRLGQHTLGVYTPGDGVPRLAYEVDVENQAGDGRWRYYVDAESGRVLDSWSLIHSALNRETYDAQAKSSRPGRLARKEGDAPVADVHINRAHDNAGAVYDYYKTLFNRDSLDNKGMKLVSTVHFGNKVNNAYWDGRQMTYGDGDGERFTPLGDALDVVGHEMAHGVTEKTANLRYFKQSGALNESWSDVFGNLIEKWEEKRTNPAAPERDPRWLIGEQIFTPKVDGDGLRSMSAPGTGYDKDPQPAHMRDYRDISYDNGGVHINSGIPNKAAYEVAQKIGTEKLARIWYRAQTNYLTSTSQFIDAANVTVQSAADLYGKDSPEVKAVIEGWTSVGLAPTTAPGIGQALPPTVR